MKAAFNLVLLALLLATVTLAQMGGGNSVYGGMMAGMMGGSLSEMMGGGSGLTVGADGTLYITRSAAKPNQAQAAKIETQLTAVDADGNVKWTLSLNTSSASQPALGNDGTLFVTTSDWLSWMYDWMYNWFYSAGLPSTGASPKLLIVKPDSASATLIHTVTLTGQVASAPRIASDNAGGYVVYVVTVEGLTRNGFDNSSSSGSYLYAFSHTGALKYRLQLSQGGAGMMGL